MHVLVLLLLLLKMLHIWLHDLLKLRSALNVKFAAILFWCLYDPLHVVVHVPLINTLYACNTTQKNVCTMPVS